MAKKFVRSTGAMRRILELLAQKEGSDAKVTPIRDVCTFRAVGMGRGA